jgi:hypothetical protein
MKDTFRVAHRKRFAPFHLDAIAARCSVLLLDAAFLIETPLLPESGRRFIASFVRVVYNSG